jgi:signal transduction histidine kinase
MIKYSNQKTRWVFIGFFLVLAIPSVVLSFQAYQQLRWQNLHQMRQVALEFTQRVDSALTQAIEKEEARSDTDYTFFVLTGSPEARFVQRSELSKFPINSDLKGLLGYFQIDESGTFSSPLLPSAYVQSEVVPSLYGISREENQQRLQLELQIKQILSDNQLVNQVANQSAPASNKQGQKSNRSQSYSRLNSLASSDSKSDEYQISQTQESTSESTQVAEQIESDSFARMAEREERDASLQRAQKDVYRAMEKKRKQDSQKMSDSGSRRAKSTRLKTAPSSNRKARTEKSYSPQQSLLDNQSNSTLVEAKDLKVKLFESEIEPFKFSQLESGHFVIYRQVWRNNKRVVQGAIITTQVFLQQYFGEIFQQSALSASAKLNVYFGQNVLQSWEKQTLDYSSRAQANLKDEPLTKINLSEPFSQFSLDYQVVDMPANGASFILLVASCLLIGLSLGTYMLYRLALKQSFLVQQQQDFVSSVSHELKTPLTSIRMYGEILKQGWVSDEKKMEYYDYIYSESERLSRLIANVLQISGVNHNALELNLDTISVSQLASLVHLKIDSQIKQSGITLNLQLDESVADAKLLIDCDAFIQIMINLVDNAIKYATNQQQQQLDIRFFALSDDTLRVSVRDYGPGIEKQHIKRIFELFYRSGNELTREVKGTGIGLALVKKLANALSADISVKNRHPGADFRIDFPLS